MNSSRFFVLNGGVSRQTQIDMRVFFKKIQFLYVYKTRFTLPTDTNSVIAFNFYQFLIQVFLHCLFGPSAVEPVFLHFILLKSKYWVGIQLLNWVQRTFVVSIIERHALSEI